MFIEVLLKDWMLNNIDSAETRLDMIRESNIILGLSKTDGVKTFHPNNLFGLCRACETSLGRGKEDCLILRSDHFLNDDFSTKEYEEIMKNFDFAYNIDLGLFVIKYELCEYIINYYKENVEVINSLHGVDISSIVDVITKNKNFKSVEIILH